MAEEGTNLWNCGNCGTQAIAAGLGYCPNCREDREMPAVNRFGQSTIFGEPNETQRAAAEAAASETGEETVDTPVESQDETGKSMADTPETPPDSAEQATEKATQAQAAFSSGDKETALSLLDQAIVLDPSRADKWTKLKEQIAGSSDT